MSWWAEEVVQGKDEGRVDWLYYMFIIVFYLAFTWNIFMFAFFSVVYSLGNRDALKKFSIYEYVINIPIRLYSFYYTSQSNIYFLGICRKYTKSFLMFDLIR